MEAVRELDEEAWCGEQGEQLHLFCEDNSKLICCHCKQVAQHRAYRSVLMEDTYQGSG